MTGYILYFLILAVVDYQEKRIPAKDRPSPAKNVGNRDSVISKPSLHRKHTPLACATGEAAALRWHTKTNQKCNNNIIGIVK